MPQRRRRNADETKANLLSAAQRLFAAEGYERATIRSVAQAAGVDPALVIRYFRSKDGLFAAAARLDEMAPDLTGVAPDRVADVLVPVFVNAWKENGPLLSLLRAAASRPTAAEALRTLFEQVMAPRLAPLAVDRAEERAALIGSQLVGIAVVRMIVRTPPLVSMSDDDLIRWLRPVIAHYLTADHV
jgi:AcrR family transcriptional regulator